MKKILIGALLLAASSTALAQAYVGGSVGRSQAAIDCADPLLACNNSSTGFKVQAGYQFTPRFAAEMVYIDLGKIDTSFSSGISANIKGTGVGLQVLGSLPFTQAWSGFARFGVNRTSAESDTRAGAIMNNRTDRTTNASVGVGVDYALQNNFSLRGEVERYRLDALDDHYNVTNVSVGVKYKF